MDILSTLFQQSTRSLAGFIIPSVVISEKHTDKLTITEHPVEVGAPVADHAYMLPAEVVMEVGFAGGGALLDFAADLTATNLLSLSPKEIYQQLRNLQKNFTLFNVVTGKRIYKDMLLKGIEVNTSVDTENVLSATLTLRQIVFSRTKSIVVADKAEMTEGVSTSPVINAGTKNLKPADKALKKPGRIQ